MCLLEILVEQDADADTDEIDGDATPKDDSVENLRKLNWFVKIVKYTYLHPPSGGANTRDQDCLLGVNSNKLGGRLVHMDCNF
uniref:Uncharacterized protein n=1 Tax=Candidozyma auris TaxID=498019 RepID=A0A0L0NTS1_CANAR